MSDIVGRLQLQATEPEDAALLLEAAAEIERLNKRHTADMAMAMIFKEQRNLLRRALGLADALSSLAAALAANIGIDPKAPIWDAFDKYENARAALAKATDHE